MEVDLLKTFVSGHFADKHAAKPCMDYAEWRVIGGAAGAPLAALAYRRAAEEPLFLEAYIDQPIEQVVSAALERSIDRTQIVEIGCLASGPGPALARLWREAAQMLSCDHEVAVATLTRPLRSMFARVGMPLVELVGACPMRLDPEMRHHWGGYYDADPIVCVGDIRAGLAALDRFAGSFLA